MKKCMNNGVSQQFNIKHTFIIVETLSGRSVCWSVCYWQTKFKMCISMMEKFSYTASRVNFLPSSPYLSASRLLRSCWSTCYWPRQNWSNSAMHVGCVQLWHVHQGDILEFVQTLIFTSCTRCGDVNLCHDPSFRKPTAVWRWPYVHVLYVHSVRTWYT